MESHTPTMPLSDDQIAELPSSELPNVRGLIRDHPFTPGSLTAKHSTGEGDYGVITWMPLPRDDPHYQASMSMLEKFSKVFSLCYIDGDGLNRHGAPLYTELSIIRNPSDDSTHAQLIESLFAESFRCKDEASLKMAHDIAHATSRTRVFLTAERSHPYGYFFQRLGLDGTSGHPEHWEALWVAFMGRVNPIPCESCIETYSTLITNTREHVNAPFFDCTSHPDFFGGSCACCIYKSTEKPCSWKLFRGHLPRSSDPREIALRLSGEAQDSTPLDFLEEPHPMADSQPIPGSSRYLTFDPAIQTEESREAEAKECFSWIKGSAGT